MRSKAGLAGMLALTGWVACIAPAQADQLSDIKAHGTLSCGVYSNVEPFSYPNAQTRQLEGMDVDICTAIAKQLGVKVSLEPLAVEARIPQLKLGRVDMVVANLAYTKTRATQVSFSDAYYSPGKSSPISQDKKSAQPTARLRRNRSRSPSRMVRQ